MPWVTDNFSLLLTAAIFFITYAGVALGGIPGLALDRTGIALLGAIAMVATGGLTTLEALQAIDASTILLLYVLAMASTFAGNLLTIGSIANLIVIEQAGQCGIMIGFREHARVGIPVTLLSLGILLLWIFITHSTRLGAWLI